MANRSGSISERPYVDAFFEAVRSGNLSLVKNKWKELKNDPASYDLSGILFRTGECYWGNSHASDEQKQQFDRWVAKTESKLAARRVEEIERTGVSYEDCRIELAVAARRLHFDALYKAIDFIKKFCTKTPELAPKFFRRDWKSAKNIVESHCDSKEKKHFLVIINDALKRLESKDVLLIAANRLRSWNLEALSEKVKEISADQASLFPLSVQTVESDWEAVRQCIDLHVSPEDREQTLSILSDIKERLDRGWNPYFDEYEDLDSGFL